MSAGAYKPAHTHQATAQSLQVWQARLRETAKALRGDAPEEAKQRLHDLINSLRPEAYPEFADNLLWLYRSTLAHIDAGERDGALAILESLHRLLETAATRLAEARFSRPPFPPANPEIKP